MARPKQLRLPKEVKFSGHNIVLGKKEIPTIGGLRLKAILDQIVIKIDNNNTVISSRHSSIADIDPTGKEGDIYTQTENEIRFLPKIQPEDTIYFAKVYRTGIYTDNQGIQHHWLIEEKLDLLDASLITEEHKEEVKKITQKYQLDGDVKSYFYNPHNWGVNKKTGKPVIFDWGVCNAA